MSTTHKALIIGVGSVQGLGASVARRFAREGLQVWVAGRTQAKLDAVVAAITAEGGTATALLADATDEPQVIALFDAVMAAPGTLEVAVFNAGNNTPGKIVDMDAAYFERAWRIICFGGFLFGREAARRMLPTGGTLIFTGASASLRGRAGFGAFNAGKGALRLMAQALAKEVGPQGLHVAHVVVDGGIDGEALRSRGPELLKQIGEERLMDRESIADAFWFLHRQGSRAWSFELDLRSKIEPW